MKATNVPRGIANIFSIGLSNTVIVDENSNHRPDRLNSSMRNEFINNYMSNTSPISCEKKKEYKLMNNMFNTYFGGI